MLDIVRTSFPAASNTCNFISPAGGVTQMVVNNRAVRRIRRVRQFGIDRLIPVIADARADGVAGFEEIHRCRRDRLRLRGDVAQRLMSSST